MCITEILYDFLVDVDKSTIPNSGNGAFLTYLGARHLKPGAYRKEAEIQKKKELHCHAELEASNAHGFCMNVKFTGEVVNNGKFERKYGIGPNFIYDESDYESSPSTVFSSAGDGNGLVRKSFFVLSEFRNSLCVYVCLCVCICPTKCQFLNSAFPFIMRHI